MVALVLGRNSRLAPEVALVHGLHVAGEFRVLLRITDGELRLGDLQAEALASGESAAGGEDEFRIQRGAVLAQRRDEAREVLFVARGVDGVVRILVALPPDEAGDFVALSFVVGVNVRDVGERSLRVGHVVVVLLAGIPFDGLAGFLVEPRRRLGGETLRFVHRPRVGLVLVAGEDLRDFRPAALGDFRLVALAAGRQQVPTEAAVADAGFQNQHRFIKKPAHHEAEADLRPDGAPVGRGGEWAAFLRAGIVVVHILSHRPRARVVQEERIALVLFDQRGERAVGALRFEVAHADHVRLAHEDEDFDLLRLVGGLAIRSRQLACWIRGGFLRRPGVGGAEDRGGQQRSHGEQCDCVHHAFLRFSLSR